MSATTTAHPSSITVLDVDFDAEVPCDDFYGDHKDAVAATHRARLASHPCGCTVSYMVCSACVAKFIVQVSQFRVFSTVWGATCTKCYEPGRSPYVVDRYFPLQPKDF